MPSRFISRTTSSPNRVSPAGPAQEVPVRVSTRTPRACRERRTLRESPRAGAPAGPKSTATRPQLRASTTSPAVRAGRSPASWAATTPCARSSCSRVRASARSPSWPSGRCSDQNTAPTCPLRSRGRSASTALSPGRGRTRAVRAASTADRCSRRRRGGRRGRPAHGRGGVVRVGDGPVLLRSDDHRLLRVRLVGTAHLGGGMQIVLEIGHNGAPYVVTSGGTATVARSTRGLPGERGVRGKDGPPRAASAGQPSSASTVAWDGARVARRSRATSSASPSTRTAFCQVSLARSARDQPRSSSSAISRG